jgi:hypothetical protein
MKKTYNGIVIFGEMGAGKDALAEQFTLVAHHCKIYNMGILCREMMKVVKVKPELKGMERKIGQFVADKLREMDEAIMCDYILSLIYESGEKKYNWDNSALDGEDFNNAVIEQLSMIRNEELSIIVGGRTLVDVNYWKKKNFLILGVKVSDHIRNSRLINRDGAETVKNSDSTHNTEADVPYILSSLCDEVIYNDGTLDELKEKARIILEKYKLNN